MKTKFDELDILEMPPRDHKRKKFMPKKKPDEKDDSSVDSKGNIRGLIDYSESEMSDIVSSQKKKPNMVKKTADVDRKVLIAKLKKEKEQLLKELKEKEEEEELQRLESEYERNKKQKDKKVETDDDDEDEDEEYDDDDEDYDEDEDYESEEYYTEDDEKDEKDEKDRKGKSPPLEFAFSFGGLDPGEKNVPKRHNMKKEAEDVKKFVKLITTPSDENTIDGQIDQFKALPDDKKLKLLSVLESHNKAPGTTNPQQGLMFKILTMNLPVETQSMVLSKYNSLQNLDPGSSEYYKHRSWLDKLTSLPLGIYKEIPVSLSNGSEVCGQFMARARKCLDDAIYGQDEAKLQILQFIGTKIANPTGRGLSLLLSGPPGIGKTSLIKQGVAKALEWPFQFISLGGDSDASTYTGHQLVYEGSHCGKIVNSLCAAKSMSLVLMFDELDKISTTPKGEEVQNLLVHLTDSVQNGEFEDKYLAGVNIDLSRVMFTFSANDLNKIDRVLLDRMIVVQLQGYSQKEKVSIAENYLLPAALNDVGLAEKVAVGREVLEHVLKEYASEESGVRELKRCIEQITQKVNMLRMFNTKDLPFHIKDFNLPFILKKEHVDLFLKKRTPSMDISAQRMYT
jgi:hypothetical protein